MNAGDVICLALFLAMVVAAIMFGEDHPDKPRARARRG